MSGNDEARMETPTFNELVAWLESPEGQATMRKAKESPEP